MVSGEDVQLPDLQVIQRYSLAVRGATAPVSDVIEALQSDLAWLTGSARRRTAAPAAKPSATAKPTPARTVAKKAPAKKSAAKKTAAKKSGARRA
jgi:DNA-binding protein HU-beta